MLLAKCDKCVQFIGTVARADRVREAWPREVDQGRRRGISRASPFEEPSDLANEITEVQARLLVLMLVMLVMLFIGL